MESVQNPGYFAPQGWLPTPGLRVAGDRHSVRFKPIVVPKSQQTPDDILVHSESNLLVFISSVTDELKWARDEAVRTFERFPCTQPWAFEYTPASSESADDAYLKKAKDADLLVWLVGSQTTQPVVNEINARIATGRRLLVFKLPAEDRDPLTRKLLTTVSGYCKWQKVNSGPALREALTASLSDEIARAAIEGARQGASGHRHRSTHVDSPICEARTT